MKVMGFDSETTGLKADAGDKLIEVALLTYDFATRKLVDKYVQRLDPERSITAGAQEVHGITYDELVGMPKFRDVAPEIHKRFEAADLVIAHNLDFDAMFFLIEFQAAGFKLPSKASLDTMTEARWACPDGKFPKLQELCFALGVKYDPSLAHAADYDVDVMMQCFWRGLDRGFYTPEMEEATV
jgi:DNA polymerase-3 subunit epsilon